MERKKKISMTVKEQRENPSSGVERTHLSVDSTSTYAKLAVAEKKIALRNFKKKFWISWKKPYPSLK